MMIRSLFDTEINDGQSVFGISGINWNFETWKDAEEIWGNTARSEWDVSLSFSGILVAKVTFP